MKSAPAPCQSTRRLAALGTLLLASGAMSFLSSCNALSPTSSTYYPQAKDEAAYRSRYKPLKDQVADDEGSIYQSHADAKRGLNLPQELPGTSYDGVSYSSYR